MLDSLVWRHGKSTQLQNMPNSRWIKLGDLSYIASFWQDIYSFSDVAEQLKDIGQSSLSKHRRVPRRFFVVFVFKYIMFMLESCF